MFQEEISELEKGFATLITTVLSKIRSKCVGVDHVLDDDDGKFSEFFLNSAKNRLSDAYIGYVFTAKTERINQNRKNIKTAATLVPIIPPIAIKTEIKMEPEEVGFCDEREHETQIMIENNLLNGSIQQETTITQTNDNFIDQLFDEPRIKTPQPEPNHYKKSSLIAINTSPKIQSPGCHTDIAESAKLEHLTAQKKLLSTLFVTGLPIDQDDHVVLSKLFMDLCRHIHISIDSKEIVSTEVENVRPNEYNLVVQLSDAQQKENIVRIAQRFKGLKASEFISSVAVTAKTRNIHVFPKLTKFYERLRDDAINYLHDKQLYSFRVCSQGLAVRCSKNSQEKYIKSRKELENFVNGTPPQVNPPQFNGLKRVNGERLDSAGPSSPKQSRSHCTMD